MIATAPPPAAACGARRSDVLCVWSGPLAAAFCGAGFLIGKLIPPPSPANDARAAVEYWSHDLDERRIGLALFVIGCTLFIPFAAAIARQLRAIEGPGSSMAAVQIAGGAATAVLGIVYVMVMVAIVFRPERSPEITLTLTDLAWLPFVGLWSPGALQAAALAVGVLGDRRASPVLPRWLGWYSGWYALASTAGGLVIFFRTGPVAWNGFIAFYLEATIFFMWYVVVFVMLRRTLGRERVEAIA